MNNYIIYKDWYQNPLLINKFTEIMQLPGPCNFSRIGGADYKIAIYYYFDNSFYDDNKNYKYWLKMAKNDPGYFDFENKKENFILYAKQLIEYFKNLDYCFYAGKDLIDQIDNNIYSKEDEKFLNYILNNKNIIHYSFIESILPFLESFKVWGENKKILIISPLSKSLIYQYQRINKIIKNYNFPKFELITIDTNLTWQHENDTKESLGLITNNWHEECNRLSKEILKVDFDVAFLSCGSYAMYCGDFIKNVMKKKSIYVGGILNVLFGIYGKRYDNSFFMQFTYPEYRINPFENEKVKKITAGRLFKNEAVFAYFGEKNE